MLIPVDHVPSFLDDEVAPSPLPSPPLPAQDVLPPGLHRPTLEELSVPGRDAIRDPMGNMTTDPTGLVGAARDIAYLPAAIEEHRDKLAKMHAAGASAAEISEADRDNPAYNALFQLAMAPVLGGALRGGAAAVRVAPDIAAAVPRLLRDESGELRLSGSRGLIGNADLDTLLPVEKRRIGPYREGVGTTPVEGGVDWPDLDLAKPGSGMQAGAADLRGAWDDAVDAVRSWSPQQAEAIDKYLAKNPQVGPNTPEFWNNALSQPDRARYWYELGTRQMQHEGLDVHPEDLRTAVNVASATSPSAEPLQNLRRTVGVLAENQQGLPVMTDLIQPGAVRMALSSGMDAPKTTNYSGTFTHIAGVDEKPPITVNDRQIAEIHGIDPDELAKNPGLYGLLSHFYQNFRDAENAARPGVMAGVENPFETWQLQAPAWTAYRGLKREAKAGLENFDDYGQVIDKIKKQLEEAGVDTTGGLFSREVLGHPNVPNLMSPTRAQFLASPTATVETATTMTQEGQRASEMLRQLPSGPEAPSWINQARYGMELVQRQAMRALSSAGGDTPSAISRLVAPILGDRSAVVSRIDTTGWGTYQNDISPNIRIPMWAQTRAGRVTLTPEQIRPLLSALGRDFGQEGTPASHFETIMPGADTGGRQRTYSLLVREPSGQPTPTAQLQQFRQLIGNEISVSRGPSGALIDIHPLSGEPAFDQVQAAAHGAFGQKTPVHIYDRGYTSHYIEHPTLNAVENYDTHLDNFWNGIRDGDNYSRDARGVRAADWTAEQRARDFADAREAVRAIAEQQRVATQTWIDKWEPRIQKWQQNPGARGQQLKPLAGLAGAGLLGAGYGALVNPAQAAQPPPRFIPVDHDPFAEGP